MPRLPGSRIPGRHGHTIAIKYIAVYACCARATATFDAQTLVVRTAIGKKPPRPGCQGSTRRVDGCQSLLKSGLRFAMKAPKASLAAGSPSMRPKLAPSSSICC